MIKRKKHQVYDWNEKTDSAIERYVKWEKKPHIQQRIFQEHIEIPLRNTSRRLIKNVMFFNKGERLMEYDPYSDKSYFDNESITSSEAYNQGLENLVDECVSFFYTTLFPYIRNSILLVNEGEEKTVQSNFGYVNSSIRHYLVNLNIERTWNSVGGKYVEELPEGGTSRDYSFILYRDEWKKNQKDGTSNSHLFEHKFDNDTIYIGELLSYWDKNIPLIWKKDNQGLQRVVAENVIKLMRRSEKIKHFKVDSMRRYLRKMMDWDSGTNIYNTKGSSGGQRNKFNRVIRFMRDRNTLLWNQFKKTGMIDYYYI